MKLELGFSKNLFVVKRSVFIIVVFLFFSSCSGSYSDKADIDARDADADTVSDTDTGGGSDSDSDTGLEAVDPQIEWIEIKAGFFTFGSPVETPCRGALREKQVEVALTHPFKIAQTEVTQKQWRALGFQVPHNLPKCDDCAIELVNFFEAAAWCNALSDLEGLERCYDLADCSGILGGGCPDSNFTEQCSAGEAGFDDNFVCDTTGLRLHPSLYDCDGYRLPSGPEWEYAAKAGTATNTYNGDITEGDINGLCTHEPIMDDIGWYCDNSEYGYGIGPTTFSLPVGQKLPNPWGLYDMLGNANEWVDYICDGLSLDEADGHLGETILTDPIGKQLGDFRGLYGGTAYSLACMNRPARYFGTRENSRQNSGGFRPVRTICEDETDAGPADSYAK